MPTMKVTKVYQVEVPKVGTENYASIVLAMDDDEFPGGTPEAMAMYMATGYEVGDYTAEVSLVKEECHGA